MTVQDSTSGKKNPYRRIALELQHRVDEMHYSRTWQLTLAAGLARRSFRDLLLLPGRVWRILTRPPQPPHVAYAYGGPPVSGLGRPEPRRPGWSAELPLVSVVVLSAGEGRGVTESLRSLHESTLQDFEVLLVHAPHADVAGASEMLATNGGLRSVEAAQPDSPSGRNKAIEAAKGKYVVLLRGGDFIDPTFLEKAAFTLEETPGLGFAYAQTTTDAESVFARSEAFGIDRELRYNHVPDSAMFRRDVWTETGGFREETQLDFWDFWVSAGTLGWSGALLREELVRLGDESIGAQLRAQQATRDTSEVGKILKRHAALLDTPRKSRTNADISSRTAAPRPADSSASKMLTYTERQFLDFGRHCGVNKPAILCVVPWLNIGGAEKVVMQLIRGLSDRFSFAVAATLDAENNRAAEFRALTPWVYPLPESCADPARYLADLAAVHGVRGVLISSSETGYNALPAFKERGLWTADIVHNTAPEGHLDQSIGFDRDLDLHFACGREQAEALHNGAGAEASKVRTVWTAADATGAFDPQRYEDRRGVLRAEFGLEERDIVLAYVGRLSIEKDVPLFVAAVSAIVRRHPGLPVRALIAGDGPELLRVEQAIEREGLWNEVRLLGDCRRVPEVLALSDYMLLTSKTEGSPITILEAMSLKLVVLSTAVGNVREVIEDGVNGFVIAGRDPAAFADRFDEIRRDPAHEKRTREAARQTILDRFDEPQMLEAYAEAFRAALGADASDRST